MQQLRDAIQSKYGVSSETSGQVIKALTEVEKHRQVATARLPGRPSAEQDAQVPNIENIIGGLIGGSSSAQSGGALSLIITIIKRLLGLGGSGQPQGGHNVTSILSDLTGGATHPGQAPDLTSILLSLLGGGAGGSVTGSGGQAADIEGLLMSLLGGQAPSRSGQTTPTSQKPK